MTGFTKGPWTQDNLLSVCKSIAIHGANGVNDIALVEMTDGGDVVHPVEANARLIAAAPDLYEALHGLANFVEVVLPRNQSYHETPAMRARLDMARAALAKAAPEKETE